jgi:hypothetical protein
MVVMGPAENYLQQKSFGKVDVPYAEFKAKYLEDQRRHENRQQHLRAINDQKKIDDLQKFLKDLPPPHIQDPRYNAQVFPPIESR